MLKEQQEIIDKRITKLKNMHGKASANLSQAIFNAAEAKKNVRRNSKFLDSIEKELQDLNAGQLLFELEEETHAITNQEIRNTK